MSHYVVVETTFTDRVALVDALEAYLCRRCWDECQRAMIDVVTRLRRGESMAEGPSLGRRVLLGPEK